MGRLFSIAVISYKNYKYIFETLDSILIQDYPYIEILVSNDASEDFNAQEVERYIKTKAKSNVVSYKVWQQPINLGTVKNAEFCRKHAKGQAFYLIAADDILENEKVISAFSKAMDEAPEYVGAFCGHVKMCDQNLESPRWNWTTSAEKSLIQEEDSRKLFSRLSSRTLIPTTGTCYRMDLLEKMGGYDCSYILIEDAPLYLRLTRNGVVFRWIEGLVAACHRDGGTCHSVVDYKSPTMRKFTADRIRIFKQEVFPYAVIIYPYDMQAMLELWYSSRSRYEKAHSGNIFQRVLLRMRHNTVCVIAYALFLDKKNDFTLREKSYAFARIMKRYLKNAPKRYLTPVGKILKKGE